MYLEREIDKTMEMWSKDIRRKPILLRGVRQCGKTSCVRQLGKSFESYVEVNFERQPGLFPIFEGDLDPARIVSRLEMETRSEITPGKTLLFLDEIQACPRAITALRYFYENMPDLHVIAAGSLLEFVLNNKKQKQRIEFPVGRVRSIYMYPLSFREFLIGTGNRKIDDYLKSLKIPDEQNDMHEKLLDIYKTFLVVGGMPEAVKVYVETGSFLKCQEVHQDIILNMRDDFDKYDEKVPSEMIRKVFDYALHHICSQVKTSSAIQGMTGYYFEECLSLLKRAGLVFAVNASSCDSIPLGTGQKETNKKLLFFDTGVYLTECGLNTSELLGTTIFDEMNKGDVVELETGLELIKTSNPVREPELYYWYRTGANAEVDYVIQSGQNVIPIEVKASGKGSMQSMQEFLKINHMSPYGIRASLENFCNYEKIHVFPVYAVNRFE